MFIVSSTPSTRGNVAAVIAEQHDTGDDALDDEQCSSTFIYNEDSSAVQLNKQKDTEEILATAAPSLSFTDPAPWGMINADLQAYWVSRGPSMCQKNGYDFNTSVSVSDEIKGFQEDQTVS